MAVADRHGLPLAIGIASGQRNEVTLVEETLDARFTKALPKRLIGDKAYDSNKLDARLALRGVEMIAPHNPTHVNRTQDGRPLRRYRRRWKVERLFAWLLRFRRIHTRYEPKPQNFLAWLKFGCLVIFLRQL